MHSAPVETWIGALVFIAVGVLVVALAPRIQKANLRLIGEPTTRLASWSYRLAASKLSLISIRLTGVVCIATGAAILGFLSRD